MERKLFIFILLFCFSIISYCSKQEAVETLKEMEKEEKPAVVEKEEKMKKQLKKEKIPLKEEGKIVKIQEIPPQEIPQKEKVEKCEITVEAGDVDDSLSKKPDKIVDPDERGFLKIKVKNVGASLCREEKLVAQTPFGFQLTLNEFTIKELQKGESREISTSYYFTGTDNATVEIKTSSGKTFRLHFPFTKKQLPSEVKEEKKKIETLKKIDSLEKEMEEWLK